LSRAEIAETVLVLLSVAALWPWAFLKYRAPWYTAVLVAVLLVMVLLCVRLVRRTSRAFREAERQMREEGASPGVLPWCMPPSAKSRGSGDDPAENN